MSFARIARPFSATRTGSAASWWPLLWALLSTTGIAAEPRPIPRRAIPAQSLVVYVEFEGLDAHADAWKATSAHALLVGTPAGGMLTELARQVTDRLLKAVPGARLDGADVLALHDLLIHQGFALAVFDRGDGASVSTLVLNGAGRKEMRERLGRLLRLVIDPEGKQGLPSPKRIGGRDVFQLVEDVGGGNRPELLNVLPAIEAEKKPTPKTPWLSWWFEDGDLVLIVGPSRGDTVLNRQIQEKPLTPTHQDHVAAVLDVLDGKRPNVSTHPAHVAALAEGKDVRGFEPDGLFFVVPGKNRGLLTGLVGGLGVGNGPGHDLVLPPARYMQDDVKFFAPGPDLPKANTQAATQRARKGASELKPPPLAVPAPPVSTAPTSRPARVRDDAPPELSPIPPVAPPAPPGPAPVPVAVEPKPVRVEEKGAEPAEPTGLEGITRVIGRWGFQGHALLTDIRVETASPRKGLLGMLDQPGFRKDRLPPIPEGVGAFGVGSIDLGRNYQALTGLLALEPALEALFLQVESGVRDTSGLRLREDILSHLGPTWYAFASPSIVKEKEDDPASYVLIAAVDDAEAFGKVLDRFATRVNQSLRDREAGDAKGKDNGREKADAPILALERLEAPERGYRLTSPAGLVPYLDDELQPTVLIGRGFVAFASHPDRARAALARESQPGGRWKPTGELIEAFACLPENLSFLSVGDPRDSSWPGGMAELPATVQMLSGFVGDLGEFDAPSVPNLLAAFGIPRPGGFRVRIDPARVPGADDLRPHLFPSVLAASVDGRGLRLIGREAVPLACLKAPFSIKSTVKWSNGRGFDRDLKLKIGLGK